MVRASCRLHFGMFGFGHADRQQFGGVGIMVEPPAVKVEIEPAANFRIAGSHGERAVRFVERATAAWQLPELPACSIAVAAPGDHIGLGVGTQLGLSIAAGLRRFLRLPDIPVENLAQNVGRASRSSVGTYGFQYGGLIVDAGRDTGQRIGKLERRVALPAEWQFVLMRPLHRRGLAGPAETDAFSRLPPVAVHVTQELWRITNEEMLPALERRDCSAFGDAVYRYGRLAGECFAAVQGGPFASRDIARLVEAIRSRGVPGVGQSSWGPTVFAICPSEVDAHALSDWIRQSFSADAHEITIAHPNNEGAFIR
jgi:beta-RFAP synthase